MDYSCNTYICTIIYSYIPPVTKKYETKIQQKMKNGDGFGT